MKYFSESKKQYMDIRDMHMMHIENVLLKDLKEDTLPGGLQAALLDAYITKNQDERQRLHRLLKASKTLIKLLMDTLTSGPRRSALGFLWDVGTGKTKETRPTLTLEQYRQEALDYIKLHGRVSADQLRRRIERSGYHVDGQTLTHVFRDKRFEQVGYRRSSFAGAKGRFINNWTAA
jgi:hypothetical protein